LAVFEAVAKHQSVTIAAQYLHMTQPAVSNIIKQLQNHYGCPLIEVIGRKLSLTVFGQSLLANCKIISATLDTIQTEIELLKGGVSGTIQVATVSTAKYFVPYLLGKFKEQHDKNDKIHIKLTVGNRQEIIQHLQENKGDFVIMSHPPDKLTVDCADFYNDELVVITGKNYTSKKSRSTHLKALEREPWIIREQGSGTRYATERVFKQHHFFPSIAMEIGDNEAIKQAVIANMGIAVISRQSVKFEVEKGLIKILTVTPFPVRHQWYLVKNKNKALSPVASKFYIFVHSH
jgi:DNA-binding transcriptional LysR family regulator